MRAVALAALVAAACSSPAKETAKPPPAAPPSTCLADRIGTIANTGGFIGRPECGDVDAPACVAKCDGGDAPACFQHAVGIEQQDGRARDALELFGKACTLGMAAACTNWAATLWSNGPDIACATRMFAKTCAVKDQFGCAMQGRLLVESGQVDAGRRELERSCDALAGPPCRFLAWFMEKGTFGEPNPARIRDLIARACDGGDDEACGEHATVDEIFHP